MQEAQWNLANASATISQIENRIVTLRDELIPMEYWDDILEANVPSLRQLRESIQALQEQIDGRIGALQEEESLYNSCNLELEELERSLNSLGDTDPELSERLTEEMDYYRREMNDALSRAQNHRDIITRDQQALARANNEMEQLSQQIEGVMNERMRSLSVIGEIANLDSLLSEYLQAQAYWAGVLNGE
jgi:chromosome segregation ATPase